MDYSARTKREQELLAALLLLFGDETLLLQPMLMEQQIAGALANHYEAVYIEAAEQLNQGRLPQSGTSDLQASAKRFAAEQSSRLARDFVRNSANRVNANTTMNDLRDIFGQGRAESLAITETTRAATEGMLNAAGLLSVLGVLAAKATWITAGDANVCPVCSPLNYRERESWELEFPSGPPAHPRCRCYLEFA